MRSQLVADFCADSHFIGQQQGRRQLRTGASLSIDEAVSSVVAKVTFNDSTAGHDILSGVLLLLPQAGYEPFVGTLSRRWRASRTCLDLTHVPERQVRQGRPLTMALILCGSSHVRRISPAFVGLFHDVPF